MKDGKTANNVGSNDIPAGIDLHSHTTASDGLLAPADLVLLASQRGLSVLGVTDHDTIDGIAEAQLAAATSGVTVVAGVELSTSIDGKDVHILGYFVDPSDQQFVARLNQLADGRKRRILMMVERLNALGHRIEIEPILEQATAGSIGRPHVARALVALGVAASVGEAFDRFLKPGKPGWVEREQLTSEDAIRLILANGAIPVLAHPYSSGNVEAILGRLVPAGLQGLEVFYGGYTPTQKTDLHELAVGWDLIPTGGSDFHGSRFMEGREGREGRELGSSPVPVSAYARLAALHGVSVR